MRSFSTDRGRARAAGAAGLTGIIVSAALAAAAAAAATAAAAPPSQPPAEAVAPDPIVFTETERARILQFAPLGAIPADPTNALADDPRAARLGQRLFFETRLSGGSVSCASCHVPPHAFTDGKPVSEGMARGRRRTPSLLNVAYRRWLFWDGRKDSLWSQALSPIENEVEMGGNRVGVARAVALDPALRAAYEDLFGPLPPLDDPARFPPAARPALEGAEGAPDPLAVAWRAMTEEDRLAVDKVFVRIGKAIEAYERRLVGGGSAFDRFLGEMKSGGDGASLSASARRGLRLFVGRGNCRACHSGPDLADGEFHDIGLPPAPGAAVDTGRYGGIEDLLADPFNVRGPHSDAPPASGAADKLRGLRRTPEHWGQYRTPSLRNVATRPPYMHQGQFATLRDVLRFYSTREGATPAGPAQEKLLVPLNLSEAETDDLIAFLESLTDAPIDDALVFPPEGIAPPEATRPRP